MSANIKEKLDNLRKMREERQRLSNEITEMKQNLDTSININQQRRFANIRNGNMSSWDRHQLMMASNEQNIAEWVHNDFEEFHRDEIEKKLKTARARVLVSGIMEEADIAYNQRIQNLGVDNLETLNAAENIIQTQPQAANRKKIIINQPIQQTQPPIQQHSQIIKNNKRSLKKTQVNNKLVNNKLVNIKKEHNANENNYFDIADMNETAGMSETESDNISVLSSRAASVLGDEERCQIISEFIDLAYARIIKIMKVYFIRAMYFEYLIPEQSVITEMKNRLLGHLHIPRSKWYDRLSLKSTIEYFNINKDGKITLETAWVMKITPLYLYVSHNMVGLGKGIKNKWRKLNTHFPIFHKITNDDINIECGFINDNHTETASTQSGYTYLGTATDIDTDYEDRHITEFISSDEEYESD